MTRSTLPVVILQSLLDFCVVCGSDEQVECRPIGEPAPVVIPCPHCVGVDQPWTLIEVAW